MWTKQEVWSIGALEKPLYSFMRRKLKYWRWQVMLAHCIILKNQLRERKSNQQCPIHMAWPLSKGLNKIVFLFYSLKIIICEMTTLVHPTSWLGPAPFRCTPIFDRHKSNYEFIKLLCSWGLLTDITVS